MNSKQISPYMRVKMARESGRPDVTQYVDFLCSDFMELKGDRLGAEDPSIYGGIGLMDGIPVTIIGHRKGKNLEDNMHFNFGMPQPEGYRKAHRLMAQAEKFGRPVLTFIDTPGAYPGIQAEEHGQSVAIAENLRLMSRLKVPVISLVTGEGNSGGALAIGLSNRVYMLENAVYSILSPEGFASILWKDAAKSQEACQVMKLTAQELKEYGLVDGVIPEPEGGIRPESGETLRQIKSTILKALEEFKGLSGQEIADLRYEKYRHFEGAFAPVEEAES